MGLFISFGDFIRDISTPIMFDGFLARFGGWTFHFDWILAFPMLIINRIPKKVDFRTFIFLYRSYLTRLMIGPVSVMPFSLLGDFNLETFLRFVVELLFLCRI